jgi:hypothetical protein
LFIFGFFIYFPLSFLVEERTMKLKRRGFECNCELCLKQREVVTDDFVSARDSLFQDFQSGKIVHSTLFFHGVLKLAAEIGDFHLSEIVCRIVAALSCDRAKDYAKVGPLLEDAYDYQTNELCLASMWAEEVNLCVQGIFAAIMTQSRELAELWTKRLDEGLGRMYPAEFVEAIGNYVIMDYKNTKMREEQAKQGPSMQQMLGQY